MAVAKTHDDGSSSLFLWGAQLETGTECGPYVKVLSLGGGVSSISPVSKLGDAKMLHELSNGRIAVRVDFCFDVLPDRTSDFSLPLLTLREDVSNYLTLRLIYDYEVGGNAWKLQIESDGDSETTVANSSSWSALGDEYRAMLRLYPDGVGRLVLIDVDNDRVEIDHGFSGFVWPSLDVSEVRIGSDVDGAGQQHVFFREIRSW